MIIAALLFYNFQLFADSQEKIFSIGTKKTTFHHYEDKRITSTEKCESLKKEVFCKKLVFLKDLYDQTQAAKIQPREGGANPGSIVCNQVLKGIVVMGVDEKGNENSFCKTPDGLLIDSGTLTYYSSAKR
jgi:putative hemolysin